MANFILYGAKHWYVSNAATGPYTIHKRTGAG